VLVLVCSALSRVELELFVLDGRRLGRAMDWGALRARAEALRTGMDALASQAQQNLQRAQLDEKLRSAMGEMERLAASAKATSSKAFFASGAASEHDLDRKVLAKIDLTYVTDRLMILGCPDAEPGRLEAVREFLNSKYGVHAQVWNLSERKYDYGGFESQILEQKFPGYPAPPMSRLLKLCMTMEAWLKSEEKNVVVVHCLTGRGRSVTVMACLLEWIGQAESAEDALRFVCDRRGVEIAEAVVPTQLRYVRMFHDIMEGIKPRVEPLCLKSVSLKGIPDLVTGTEEAGTNARQGCRPYVQVFKNGKLVFTTIWADEQSDEGTRFFEAGNEAEFKLDIDCFVDGDILLRVRHLNPGMKKGSSIFRYGFHTGYCPSGQVKLDLADMDGASVDSRMPENMEVILEFETTTQTRSDSNEMFDNAVASTKASFWDEIARRRQLARERTPSQIEKLISASSNQEQEAQSIEKTDRGEKPLTSKQALFSILDDDDVDDDENDLGGIFQKKSFSESKGHDLAGELKENAIELRRGTKVSDGDELFQELEALEKDIGPVGIEPSGNEATHEEDDVQNEETGVDEEDDDPDLAELEKYLEEM